MKARKVVYIVLLLVLGLGFVGASCAARGRVPAGIVDGRLTACPGSPNCVCSDGNAEAEAVEPLAFSGSAEGARESLRRAVIAVGGKVQREDGDYVWATCTSRVFRFIDDLEFRVDAAGQQIHVRSASRVGYSDLGVNRKRVERLRQAFAQAQAETRVAPAGAVGTK